MGQSKEIEQSWTVPRNFDIFWVIFSCYDQSLISGRETGHEALPSTNFEIFLMLSSFLRSSQQTFVLMKTFWWRRICSPYSYVLRRGLQEVFIKTNIFALVIRFQDVFKTFWKHLQDIFETSCKVVFKTFSGRIIELICSC